LTPEELSLDSEFFSANQPLTLYRLARAKYANLAGIGAAQYPGRWNLPSQEAIYSSTEKSAAILESLAHIPKDLIPSNLALMKIRVSGKWEVHSDGLIDPHTGGRIFILRTLAFAFSRAPQKFGIPLNTFAAAVPSVIVPVWNVVLYPQVLGFWNHVTLETVEPFDLTRDCSLRTRRSKLQSKKIPQSS
jgi:RES domain